MREDLVLEHRTNLGILTGNIIANVIANPNLVSRCSGSDAGHPGRVKGEGDVQIGVSQTGKGALGEVGGVEDPDFVAG